MVQILFDINQYPLIAKSVRLFKNPLINFKAPSYHQMTPLSRWKTPPPVLEHFNNHFIKSLEQIPLKLQFECHNQSIERHVKAVTEATGAVYGHDRKDGHIRNKIKLQKLMKSHISKKYFNLSAF